VSPAPSGDGNCIEGTVSSVLFLGDVFEYWIASGSHEIRMRTSAGDLSPGDSVRPRFPKQRCLALTQ